MELMQLERRPENWDRLITQFPQKSIFHESAWLDFLSASSPRTGMDYFEIREGAGTVGYFCAIRSRKFFFNLWEPPHNSIYMCPVVHPEVDQLALVQLLVDACWRERIAYLELCGPWLEPAVMARSRFVSEHQVSHICPLSGGIEGVWARMHGTCRTRIRKAEKSGLTVEATTAPGFVDEFYSRFSALLAQKGKVPGYGIDQTRQMFERLTAADRLFALLVKQRDRIIGAAFYPHDERAMYLGDVAYDVESLPLCPTHLLHWGAMRLAIERGIPLFWMGGHPVPSRFTRKFGGDSQEVIRYRRNIIPLWHEARRGFIMLRKGKESACAFWSKGLSGGKGAPTPDQTPDDED